MNVTAGDLNKQLKEKLRQTITSQLFKLYRTLPMDDSTIVIALQDAEFRGKLDSMVKDYYLQRFERDVKVDISITEYRDIYLNYI